MFTRSDVYYLMSVWFWSFYSYTYTVNTILYYRNFHNSCSAIYNKVASRSTCYYSGNQKFLILESQLPTCRTISWALFLIFLIWRVHTKAYFFNPEIETQQPNLQSVYLWWLGSRTWFNNAHRNCFGTPAKN